MAKTTKSSIPLEEADKLTMSSLLKDYLHEVGVRDGAAADIEQYKASILGILLPSNLTPGEPVPEDYRWYEDENATVTIRQNTVAGRFDVSAIEALMRSWLISTDPILKSAGVMLESHYQPGGKLGDPFIIVKAKQVSKITEGELP